MIDFPELPEGYFWRVSEPSPVLPEHLILSLMQTRWKKPETRRNYAYWMETPLEPDHQEKAIALVRIADRPDEQKRLFRVKAFGLLERVKPPYPPKSYTGDYPPQKISEI